MFPHALWLSLWRKHSPRNRQTAEPRTVRRQSITQFEKEDFLWILKTFCVH